MKKLTAANVLILTVSAIISMMIQVMARASALAERGDEGIGGEMFVFPVCLICLYWIGHKAYVFAKRYAKEKRRHNVSRIRNAAYK